MINIITADDLSASTEAAFDSAIAIVTDAIVHARVGSQDCVTISFDTPALVRFRKEIVHGLVENGFRVKEAPDHDVTISWDL